MAVADIDKIDDPILLGACDVYASLDGAAWTYVGTAYEPCTETWPFKLPIDPGLIGTGLRLKFAPMGTKQFGRDHSCLIRGTVLRIAAQ
jgi:hypothetical protein